MSSKTRIKYMVYRKAENDREIIFKALLESIKFKGK